jgi:hypothetical protein
MLTPERIDELVAMEREATAADKWRAVGNTLYIGDAWWAMLGQVHDVRFIAALRNASPELLRLAKLGMELERLLVEVSRENWPMTEDDAKAFIERRLAAARGGE